MTSARIIVASLVECDFPSGSNHVKILHNVLGWRIVHHFLIPTCMIIIIIIIKVFIKNSLRKQTYNNLHEEIMI